MARPVTTLLVFFICFNLFAGMLMSTGTADAIGLGDTNVGGGDAEEEVDTDVPTNDGIGDTLFGLWNALSNFLGGWAEYLTPGIQMLENAGLPSEITGMFRVLFGVLIAIDVISFLRGWGL